MDITRFLDLNDWANARIIEVCHALAEAHLDAAPRPEGGGGWTIRENLVHLVEAQDGYVRLLANEAGKAEPAAWVDLPARAKESGARLRTIARKGLDDDPIRTKDGYRIEPWTVMVQAIHHAIEHRKQIAALMRARGLEPPRLDTWGYGEAIGAVVPPPERPPPPPPPTTATTTTTTTD